MKPKIGLALGGGGAKGFAHIGVIKSLEKNEIPIDAISGVSAGSLVGGMYASGTPIGELENICYSSGYRDIIKLILDPIKGKGGVIAGRKIANFIRSHMKKIKIEDFPIKFGCAAVDLISGKLFYFKRGNIIDAVMASSAVPGIFTPIKYEGKYLVDGGVLEPISLNLVKELGGEVNIGIDLASYPGFSSKIKKEDKISIKDTVKYSYKIISKGLTDFSFRENPDILRIKPDVSKVGIFMFGSKKIAKKTVEEGERAMDKNIPKVKEMIENYRKD
ncbi:MAG: hypothetical protein GF368_01300 [Candidatus Aenigmarchaeota archaeon]|nr:hypothetical protein [Candidatus Aenigmarchaeota archaeon]